MLTTIGGNSIGQNLQGHFAIEPGVLRQIHLAHATRAQAGADFVAPEFCARTKHRESMRTPAHSIKGKCRSCRRTAGEAAARLASR